DGIVVSRNVDVGQTVAAAVQAPVLFIIAADLRHMQVEVDIDERDVGGVQPGEAATFQVESYPGEAFRGQVSAIRLQPIAEQTTIATSADPSVASQTTTAPTVVSYATMVDVANGDERLRPGMTAMVELAGLRRDNAVRIPNIALSFRPPAEVLEAAAEAKDARAQDASAPGKSSIRQVWQYDGRRFTAIAVWTGLDDRQWTEM